MEVPASELRRRRVLADLSAQCEHMAALLERCGDLALPTPAQDWSIGDTVTHLWATNNEATLAVREPVAFRDWAERARGNLDLREQQRREGRNRGRTIVGDWRASVDEMLAALGEVSADMRVPWYGPTMSVVSLATARLMEHWAHGVDLSDAIHEPPDATERLRHVAHLGHRTRDWSFRVRGLEPPSGAVRVELDSPGGAVWSFGPPDAPDRVDGSALDFCLVVTQRRHVDDTGLRRTPGADAWLRIAQCYAGSPGVGRAPSSQRASDVPAAAEAPNLSTQE